jgi:hypothetical protein
MSLRLRNFYEMPVGWKFLKRIGTQEVPCTKTDETHYRNDISGIIKAAPPENDVIQSLTAGPFDAHGWWVLSDT